MSHALGLTLTEIWGLTEIDIVTFFTPRNALRLIKCGSGTDMYVKHSKGFKPAWKRRPENYVLTSQVQVHWEYSFGCSGIIFDCILNHLLGKFLKYRRKKKHKRGFLLLIHTSERRYFVPQTCTIPLSNPFLWFPLFHSTSTFIYSFIYLLFKSKSIALATTAWLWLFVNDLLLLCISPSCTLVLHSQ